MENQNLSILRENKNLKEEKFHLLNENYSLMNHITELNDSFYKRGFILKIMTLIICILLLVIIYLL